jgi:hypothetical protein
MSTTPRRQGFILKCFNWCCMQKYLLEFVIDGKANNFVYINWEKFCTFHFFQTGYKTDCLAKEIFRNNNFRIIFI